MNTTVWHNGEAIKVGEILRHEDVLCIDHRAFKKVLLPRNAPRSSGRPMRVAQELLEKCRPTLSFDLAERGPGIQVRGCI